VILKLVTAPHRHLRLGSVSSRVLTCGGDRPGSKVARKPAILPFSTAPVCDGRGRRDRAVQLIDAAVASLPAAQSCAGFPLTSTVRDQHQRTQTPRMCALDSSFIAHAAAGNATLGCNILAPRQCKINSTDIADVRPRFAIRVQPRRGSEDVRAFVAGIAVLAFHPSPLDTVPSRGVVERAPQVAVLDRLLVRCRPAETDRRRKESPSAPSTGPSTADATTTDAA
jgi:hypothetical protein